MHLKMMEIFIIHFVDRNIFAYLIAKVSGFFRPLISLGLIYALVLFIIALNRKFM